MDEEGDFDRPFYRRKILLYLIDLSIEFCMLIIVKLDVLYNINLWINEGQNKDILNVP